MATSASSLPRYLLNQVALSNAIRRLWADNSQWTWALIYSILYGQADRNAVVARLQRNADDFASIFSEFYGQQTGELVREYINNDLEGTIRMIEAYKANDVRAVRRAREYLYRNADELSRHLSRVNPYWDMPSLQVMFNEIINLLEYETMLIRDGRPDESIRRHDELMEQAYRLSDDLTYGILKQFQV
ncbi:MAG TPA: hypothetical protein VN366_00685 [Feifaniaceae bacterium]|nr:hypothetical protein [Feifaniaceae bacterium]